MMDTVKLVKKHLNPGLDVEGVVLTMFDARTNLLSRWWTKSRSTSITRFTGRLYQGM